MNLIAILLLAVCPSVASAAPQAFGEKITLTTSTSLKAAIQTVAAFKDKEILATGTVEKVCEKKGCWMTIRTDAAEVRVTFKDYGFFVPVGSAGKPVRIQGRLEQKEVSVADQKHLLEDAGAPKAQIDGIKSPKQEYSFVASGVEIGL